MGVGSPKDEEEGQTARGTARTVLRRGVINSARAKFACSRAKLLTLVSGDAKYAAAPESDDAKFAHSDANSLTAVSHDAEDWHSMSQTQKFRSVVTLHSLVY